MAFTARRMWRNNARFYHALKDFKNERKAYTWIGRWRAMAEETIRRLKSVR